MFRSPAYLLWMLPAIALAGACILWAANRRMKLSRLFGQLPTLARLTRSETPRRRKFKAALEIAALSLLFLTLAGPQWGVEIVPTLSKTHQVVIAVDLSLSMLAPDIRPTRLEKAKSELSLLLDHFKGNRVGVVAFAGDAAVLCPVTTDVEAAKQVLGSLEVGAIPRPGTAIGKAIRRATGMLSRYSGGKAIVLLSDGEDHETEPLKAAAEAAGEGVRIFTIGIGTPEGEPLPLKDQSGNMTGYKMDRSGKTVVSRLRESTLRRIAEKTGGAYFRSTPGEEEVAEIVRRIFMTGESEGILGSATQYKNRFLLPLALAFIILLLELLIPETAFASKSLAQAPPSGIPPREKSGVSVGSAALLAAFLLWHPAPAAAATAEGHLRKGNKLYGEEKYVPALESYSKANKSRPKDPRPVFNAGSALYRIKEFDQAASAFKALDVPQVPKEVRAAALYNLGNMHFQKEDYGTAVKAYRQALIRQPEDPDIRHNLAIALRRKRKPPPKKKQDKKNKDKKKEDKKKKPDPKEDKKSKPPEPATRPQDQLSREDAERILRSASEKEKKARQRVQKRRVRSKPPDVKEDW